MRRLFLAVTTAILLSVCTTPALAAQPPVSTRTGQISVFHTDGHRDTFTYQLRSPHQRLTLRFTPEVRKPPPGSFVSLRLRGHTVKRVTIQRRLRTTPQAPQTRKVAVLLVNFSDDQKQPVTVEHAKQTLAETTAYYAAQSFGQLNLTGDVYGYYTLPDKHEGCAYTQRMTDAETAATAAGVNLSAYTNVMLVTPESECGWAGAGYISGRESWENGSMETVRHELGHNLGLFHAQSLVCENAAGQPVTYTTLESACRTQEYGDPYDTMGGGRYEFNNYFKGILGWWPASTITTVTRSGTYTVAPDETCCEGTHVLRVPKTDGTYYYLEFRQPSTYDNWAPLRWHEPMPVEEGISIRLGGDFANPTPSRLLNTNPTLLPNTNPVWEWFAPLTTGETYTDPATGMAVTTTGFSPAGATVSITVPAAPTPPADTTPPSSPTSLHAMAQPAGKVTLTWGTSKDNVAVAGYELQRNNTTIATPTGTTVTDIGLTPGQTYAYRVRAKDAAGNTSNWTATVKVLARH